MCKHKHKRQLSRSSPQKLYHECRFKKMVKQADDYFEALGYQPHSQEFCHRRGFFQQNRGTVGMACAQAVSLRGAPTTVRRHVAAAPRSLACLRVNCSVLVGACGVTFLTNGISLINAPSKAKVGFVISVELQYLRPLLCGSIWRQCAARLSVAGGPSGWCHMIRAVAPHAP
jgi:hypothetical protein